MEMNCGSMMDELGGFGAVGLKISGLGLINGFQDNGSIVFG